MMDTNQGVLYPKIVSIVNQEVFNVEVGKLTVFLMYGNLQVKKILAILRFI